MSWIMELKIKDKWRPIHATGQPPYKYDTKIEAVEMANLCYPDQIREARLGAEHIVRVREVTDEEYEALK